MVQLSRMVLFTLFPSTASTRPSSSGSSLLLELVLPGAFEVIISLFRLGRTPLWVSGPAQPDLGLVSWLAPFKLSNTDVWAFSRRGRLMKSRYSHMVS